MCVVLPGACKPKSAEPDCAAEETLCDGIDEDCDGVVDDGVTTALYVDDDQDGFGNAAREVQDCPQARYSAEPSDCDDQTSTTNPSADEHCDGVDENCDGAVDNDAVDFVIVYTDSDGDGYGDLATARQGCPGEDGTSELPGDCDDSDGGISPAATDACDDGLDGNCDGVDAQCVVTDFEIFDAGWFAAGLGNVVGDGGGAFAIGTYIFAGVPLSSPVGVEAAYAWTDSEASARGAGDLDGDGATDVLWTASAESLASVSRGPLVAGLTEEADRDWVFTTSTSLEAGTWAGLGDITGDGIDDLGVGAASDYSDSYYFGGVFIVSGPPAGGPLEDMETVIMGDNDNQTPGSFAIDSAGDMNGDGAVDIALVEIVVAGGVFLTTFEVFYGPLGVGSYRAGSGDGLIEFPDDNFTVWLSGAGDTEGDGYDDLLVATHGDTNDPDLARAFLLCGPARSGQVESVSSTAFIGHEDADAVNGISAAGDFDGDGFHDVAVGSSGERTDAGAMAGAVFLFLGPIPTGSATVGSAERRIDGTSASMELGVSVADAGDLDGDGLDDLLVTGAVDSAFSVFGVLGE